MEVIDHISFRDLSIDVYDHPDFHEPYFRLKDFADVHELENIEHDEWSKIDGEIYVNEIGLYNILAHQDSDSARMWRRVIFEQLRGHRLDAGNSMSDEFNFWDEMCDYYIDEETGKLMKSVTVAGGDVIQVPA